MEIKRSDRPVQGIGHNRLTQHRPLGKGKGNGPS
jgi:hypothetical protein